MVNRTKGDHGAGTRARIELDEIIGGYYTDIVIYSSPVIFQTVYAREIDLIPTSFRSKCRLFAALF